MGHLIPKNIAKSIPEQLQNNFEKSRILIFWLYKLATVTLSNMRNHIVTAPNGRQGGSFFFTFFGAFPAHFGKIAFLCIFGKKKVSIVYYKFRRFFACFIQNKASIIGYFSTVKKKGPIDFSKRRFFPNGVFFGKTSKKKLWS